MKPIKGLASEMSIFWASLRTWSYWRYAIFSFQAVAQFLTIVGAIWLFLELFDFLRIYTKDKYSALAFPIIMVVALIGVVVTRRPVMSVQYKIPKRDFRYEVRIGDILKASGEIVISTSTTFDTAIANGLISPDSLQGQFLIQYFQGNIGELDRQIAESLKGQKSRTDDKRVGKKKVYPIGTIARVRANGKNFYFLAMSELNQHGNAASSLAMIDQSLESLWSYMALKGELGGIVMPVLGTGRGRVNLSRKKMIERIAQSFADASTQKIFANKLTIVVHPDDARKNNVNLFEVRDFLGQSLHV